ncbi:beta-galactosidase [Candidatus Saccharibacteria bacterium]|nr:beta-galactosidase [Candidatus Saccharibacteria bacterium]
MPRRRHLLAPTPYLGGSFSVKYCRELTVEPKACLRAILGDLGVRRLRLMSYWNEHEKQPGSYDFAELDWQMDMAAEYGARVSLCLGKRQPRWPECHMPDWAHKLDKAEWYEHLYAFIRTVVERYRDHPALESWQLENEALLRSFGHCPDKDFSHARLRKELATVKRLDPMHPVIMTLSDNWGFPWRRPWPDIFGFSVYTMVMNKRRQYEATKFAWWWHRFRANVIRLVTRRPVILHELQAEPWGDRPIPRMTPEQQAISMNPERLGYNVGFACRIDKAPVYLWGLEWWYLRRSQGDEGMWSAARRVYRTVRQG